jgi:hypothetical protein
MPQTMVSYISIINMLPLLMLKWKGVNAHGKNKMHTVMHHVHKSFEHDCIKDSTKIDQNLLGLIQTITNKVE